MLLLASDTTTTPSKKISEFPFAETFWLIRVITKSGHTLRSDPRCVKAVKVQPTVIENITSGTSYGGIQDAISHAQKGEEIVISPSAWQYLENIDFEGKNIILRSTEPGNAAAVENTVINGDNFGPAVTFSGGENRSCLISGLTITDGTVGIKCARASPKIANCLIV